MNADFEAMKALGPANLELSVASKTRDEKRWMIVCTCSDSPAEYRIYDKVVSNPALLEYTFTGLDMVSYLTWADTGAKTPLILLVNGGPCGAGLLWLQPPGPVVCQPRLRHS